MAPLSDEENNYIRLALLLIGVSPRAVRTFFDKEFHPSNLHSTLNKNKPILHDLRLKKTLNSYQWNLLFPKNGLTNSSNFDVTMMICLIRNLTPVTPPLTGFDSLPTQAETSPESDLARIKCYRNILAHLNSDTIDTVFFNTAWGEITEAVGRLGGQRMKHECQELKVKILDQSNQELMNEIKQSQREIRELQDIIKRLLNKVRRNCLSALDILGGQIKKQSNQEITIQIKKAEREIRELEDIMERLHNKLWRYKYSYTTISQMLSLFLIFVHVAGSKKETPDDPPTPSLFVDKCENDISTATVGEPICIPYTQQFTSNPSGIQVKQVSSQYFSALPSFSINVSSDTVSQKNEDWIVNFNISRPDQQLRFIKENATCDSIGIYEITIESDDGNDTSFEFEIRFQDPQLEQSVTRLNDKVFVHCEMKKTCMASSLALFVNDKGSSRLIPDIDVCSFTDKNSGTTVSADEVIHVSQLSENQTISCVPLMMNMELAANLTSTSGIPVCEGDCVPDCKDDAQGEAYFPDKNDCTQFYQCSNGQLVSQSCSLSTYWSTSKCTCVHFNDEICNKDTNSPLLSIEKCTNASLV
ncbi:uncharacterized protein LOC143066215 [Mytilus galloprovincialis]|uniref:uncharacterized protein LOC143066215 n=1 Tax=Mytilus galloprovincialis TaxID=29158 RepID=UPI003F7C5607